MSIADISDRVQSASNSALYWFETAKERRQAQENGTGVGWIEAAGRCDRLAKKELAALKDRIEGGERPKAV
jgi:hypothetical protein